MSNDLKKIAIIESLSNDIEHILEEIRNNVSYIKDPIFVDQANVWLDSLEEALEACNESIEEFMDSDGEDIILDDDESEESKYDSMDYESEENY